MARKSSTTHGPVTSSRSTITRGLIRRATATHSAFIRLTKATSDAWPLDRTARRRRVAVAMEGQAAEVVVEEVGGDVAHRPERAGGGPAPSLRR